jgi:hypothetical protein
MKKEGYDVEQDRHKHGAYIDSKPCGNKPGSLKANIRADAAKRSDVSWNDKCHRKENLGEEGKTELLKAAA